MTIQEEIREGIEGEIARGRLHQATVGAIATAILQYLDSKGVVIRIGAKLRPNPYRDENFHLAVAFDEGKYSVFNATERLIEE